jgi:tropomyosin-1
MDAIKKKMQSMKLEKDNAMDRADQMEQTARDANARADRAEEEVRNLQKKIQQIENEFDTCQEQLMAANTKLEEKEKALQNVSFHLFIFYAYTAICTNAFHPTLHLIIRT